MGQRRFPSGKHKDEGWRLVDRVGIAELVDKFESIESVVLRENVAIERRWSVKDKKALPAQSKTQRELLIKAPLRHHDSIREFGQKLCQLQVRQVQIQASLVRRNGLVPAEVSMEYMSQEKLDAYMKLAKRDDSPLDILQSPSVISLHGQQSRCRW